MTVKLPKPAAEKLRELELQKMTSEDIGHATTARINGLPRDVDPVIRQRLMHERDRQSYRSGQLNALIQRINAWLRQLPQDAELEMVPSEKIELKRGEKLSDVLSAARDKVKSLRNHLATIKAAPPTKADKLKLLAPLVDEYARLGDFQLNVVRNQLKLSFVRAADIHAPDDAISLVCALLKDAVMASLESKINAEVEPVDALADALRRERTPELLRAIEQAEREEESLVEMCLRDGIDCGRRPDCDPKAVLCIQVKRATQQEAA